MTNTNTEHSSEKMKQVYEQLAFIHSILTQRTQFNVQEFDIAKDSTKTITEMANKLADEIKAMNDAESKKAEAEMAAVESKPVKARKKPSKKSAKIQAVVNVENQ